MGHRPPRGSELVHPIPVGATILLALNDHWLKHAHVLPRAITGKLSDVCGLFVFPVLLVAILGARRIVVVGSALATGILFAAVKLSPWFNAWVSPWSGTIVLDSTDLVALPALGLSARWLLRVRPGASSPGARLGALVLTSATCIATSPAHVYIKNYPAWQPHGDTTRVIGCVDSKWWVSKSGKEGFGITVRVHARPGGCRVRVTHAVFAAGPTVVDAPVRAPTELSEEVTDYIYLPFAFDNNTLWNQGIRRGMLDLGLSAVSASGTESAATEHAELTQELHGYFRDLRGWRGTSN
jgi:hypothetical protein